MNNRGRFFSLIELLVVIAIISLLLAMMLPALKSARQTTLSLSCVNNERQLFVGLSSYVDDSGGYLVKQRDNINGISWYIHGKQGTPITVYGNYQPLIWEYIKNENVFFCPTATPRLQRTTRADLFVADYSLSVIMSSDSFYSYKQIVRVPNPSTVYYLGDARMEWMSQVDRVSLRHGNGHSANMLMADGHVENHDRSTLINTGGEYYYRPKPSEWTKNGDPYPTGPGMFYY